MQLSMETDLNSIRHFGTTLISTSNFTCAELEAIIILINLGKEINPRKLISPFGKTVKITQILC